MGWMGKLLYGLIGMSLGGSVVFAAVALISRFILLKRNAWGEILWGYKLTAVSFVCPLVVVLVFKEDIRLYFATKGMVRTFTADHNESVRLFFLCLILIWIAGAIKSIYSYAAAKKKIARGLIFREDVDPKTRAIFQKVREKTGCREECEVYRWPWYHVPIAFKKDVILLPVREMSEKELEICLAHELNHLKARDLRWKQWVNIICTIHWFNPAVYFFRREFTIWSEAYCDIRSLLTVGQEHCSKKEYYETVFKFCGEGVDFKSGIALSGGIHEMKERMLRVKEYNWKPICRTKLIPVVFLVFVLLAGSAMASERATAKLDDRILDHVTVFVYEGEDIEEEEPEEVECRLSEEEAAKLIVIPVQEKANSRSVIDFEIILAPGESYIYEQEYYAKDGEKIAINVVCRDSSSYQYGIKCPDGWLRYVEGSGTVSHDFEIRESGSYYIYLKNTGTRNIEVGVAVDIKK